MSFEGFGRLTNELFLFWEGVTGVRVVFFILVFRLRIYRNFLELSLDFIINLILFNFLLAFFHLASLQILTDWLFYFDLWIRLIRLIIFLLILYFFFGLFFCLFLRGIFDDGKLSNFAIWPISEDHYDEETDLLEVFHFLML